MPEAAFPSPYTDAAITFRGPFTQEITNPLPEAADANLGMTTVYNDASTDQTPGDQGAEARVGAGNSWVYGRDRYANGGAVGQEYLNNPST